MQWVKIILAVIGTIVAKRLAREPFGRRPSRRLCRKDKIFLRFF